LFIRKNNKKLMYIILPVLLVVGFSIGYFVNYDRKGKTMQKPLTGKERVVETTPSNDKIIEPGAKVTYQRLYKSCNEKYTKEDDIDTEYVGLNKEELKRAYKGWTIKYFAPKHIRLYKEEDGYCPRHFIIGEKDGYVDVYKNVPGKGLKSVQSTDILVKSLRHEYQENIKDGIVVDTEEKMYQILADISS